MSIRRSVGRVLTVAGIGVALSVAWVSPASAHSMWIFHGSDSGVVWQGHNGVSVQDKECDGNYVRIEYHVSTIGGIVPYSLTDANGCQNGESTRSHHPQRVIRARVCEANVSCTSWHTVS